MTPKAPTRVEDAHKTSKKAVDFRNLVVGELPETISKRVSITKHRRYNHFFNSM